MQLLKAVTGDAFLLEHCGGALKRYLDYVYRNVHGMKETKEPCFERSNGGGEGAE